MTDLDTTLDDLVRPGVQVPAPDAAAAAAARERLAGLATPAGALGRLGELAVWLSAVQGSCPPRPVRAGRAVVLAGDHGVAAHGVSAYPSAVTAAMVRAFVSGTAGAAVLARHHGVALRVLDIAVAADLDDVAPEVRAHHVRAGSGAIHLEDALTAEQARESLALGARIAAEEVAAGADLLICGDLGIGNTTPSAALIGALLALPADRVTGTGTGVTGAALAHKRDVVAAALSRTSADDRSDAELLLRRLGSADIAAAVGFLVAASRMGVPVLLDGVVSVAEALVATTLAPGAAAWFAAGHRSPEPAQTAALEALGLQPLLDLGMRLGEGSGALAAFPLLGAAADLLAHTGLLADL